MFAVSGMDITADIQDVANTVERLKKELADLKGRVADDELLQKIAGLESKMDKFLSDKR
jgi:predicted RNase H-like nuclease (RuvC/YqgF family)